MGGRAHWLAQRRTRRSHGPAALGWALRRGVALLLVPLVASCALGGCGDQGQEPGRLRSGVAVAVDRTAAWPLSCAGVRGWAWRVGAAVPSVVQISVRTDSGITVALAEGRAGPNAQISVIWALTTMRPGWWGATDPCALGGTARLDCELPEGSPCFSLGLCATAAGLGGSGFRVTVGEDHVRGFLSQATEWYGGIGSSSLVVVRGTPRLALALGTSPAIVEEEVLVPTLDGEVHLEQRDVRLGSFRWRPAGASGVVPGQVWEVWITWFPLRD